MASARILSSRYRGDVELLESLRGDATLGPRLKEVRPDQHQNAVRARLLATAVRVQPRLLPKIARSFDGLRDKAEVSDDLEAYVFESSSVNAFVTRGRSHLLVGLSSGAVNDLTEEELEFVVGHELGHAVFQHLEFGGMQLLQNNMVDPRGSMQILAWNRAAEISADRAGLVCCRSLDVAATAIFKSLSGLNISGLSIDAIEFSQQWEHLMSEVSQDGGDDHWHWTHPFPPLRVKALVLFWQSGFFAEAPADLAAAVPWQGVATDAEVERLLAMMDPLARESKSAADPLLADFFLWGGLYLSLANGDFDQRERDKLESLASRQRVADALAGGASSSEQCLARFGECIARRHQKLKALEIHRIVQGLLHVGHADGGLDAAETTALKQLADKLGVGGQACELLISNFASSR